MTSSTFPKGYAFLLSSCHPSYKQTHSLLCNGIEGLAFHTKPSLFREHMQAHAGSRPDKSPITTKSAPCHHPFHWSFHIPKTGKITKIESRISWFILNFKVPNGLQCDWTHSGHCSRRPQVVRAALNLTQWCIAV